MLFLESLAFLLFAQAINGQELPELPASGTSTPGDTTTTSDTTATSTPVPEPSTIFLTGSSISSTISSTSISSSTSITSPSSTTTPDPTPFIIPTSTATLPISVSTTPPASTETPFIVANPANPSESATFAVSEIPPEQRDGLPDATDAAPAAILLLGFAFPVLMFSNFQFVYAVGATPAWLTLGLFPSVAQINGFEGPGSPEGPGGPESPGGPEGPEGPEGPDSPDPTTGEPSPTNTQTSATSTSTSSSSSSSSTSTGSVSTITTSVEVDISSIIGEYGGDATDYTFIEQYPGEFTMSTMGPPGSTPSSSETSSTTTSTSPTIISLTAEPLTTTSTSPTIISLTTSPPTETSTPVPSVRTVTSNGMVCTLVQGSNHPVCHPETTPIPNPAGTNIHVNDGCISVNGSPRCAAGVPFEASYNVASQNEPYSTVTIYANFDASNKFDTSATPGCELNARWPANYGDIYFGEDRCLYDGSGSRIWDQCCTSSSSASVQNPYHDPRPAVTCQSESTPILYIFEIWLKDWGVESELKKQIDGCGAITSWYWHDTNELKNDFSRNRIGQYRAQKYASFNIDIFFKEGCIGRAIASANGPSVYC